ncbi:neuroserpin-like [Lethenteron reissneri]|uniref:neuroserpin-like n=1 Tax=Lethenteron reissneri TaxID=7753 RepID=UPI002AB707EA|nr:neuroserpin-like [Lethenteron reissneri]
MRRALSACLALWALTAGYSVHAGVAISPPPPPARSSSSSSSSSPAPPLAATPSPGRARMHLDPSAALGLELYHALRAAAGGATRNLLFSPLAAAATLGLAKRAEPGDSGGGGGGGGGGARAAARREMHGGGGTADAAAPAGADRGDLGSPAAVVGGAAPPPPLSVSEWSDQARLASALFLRANATGPAEGNGSGGDGVYRLGAVSAHDAADSINSWAERCTAGGVPELVTEQDVGGPSGARWGGAADGGGAALVSAAWFHGRWQRAFPAENTRRFHFSRDDGAETQLSMMYQQAELPYAEVSEGQLVEVPCEGGELALVLALPRQEVPLASLERALRPRLLSDWIHALKRQRVELYLPRFRLDVRTALGEALVKIGHVKDALAAGGGGAGGGGGGAAALAAASLQRAVLDVTEDGTEALSPAGLNSMGKSPGYLYPQVIADHPFFFLLRSRVTGAVLLMGRLTDPDPVADVDFNVDVL